MAEYCEPPVIAEVSPPPIMLLIEFEIVDDDPPITAELAEVSTDDELPPPIMLLIEFAIVDELPPITAE